MAFELDPYRELGLSPEAAAEPELVRAAFKALAKKYHPDRHPDAEGKARAEEKMRRLNEAQQLILSGQYRPPATVSMVPSAEVAASPPGPPAVRKPSRAAEARRPMSFGPVLVAVLILVACVTAPILLKRDHLAEALELEKQGQFSQALEKANLAVADDPRAGEPYLVRARLWLELGQPERARTDLANARGSISPSEYEKARLSLFPSPTPAPSP